MDNSKARSITVAEWEVMRVVWAKGPSSSKDVQHALENDLHWKPSTTKTLIGRLREKGILKAEKEGRHLIYEATLTEKEAFCTILSSFFSQVCHRKVGDYLFEFIDRTKLSKKDIEKLLQLLEGKLATAPDQLACQCLEGQCTCQSCG